MLKQFFLLASLLFFSSCLNDDDQQLDIPEMQPLFGEAAAELNGSPFTFVAYAMQTQNEGLIRVEFDNRDDQRGYNRNISFSNVPLKTGVVDSLFNYASPIQFDRSYCYYTAANGDLVYAFYDLVENDPDTYFEITEIAQNLVKGKFQIALAIMDGFEGDKNVVLEDTIRLTEGVFVAPLRN